MNPNEIRRDPQLVKLLTPYVKGHPIDEELLSELIEAEIIVAYQCSDTDTHVLGLKPRYRREMYQMKPPIGFQRMNQKMTPKKEPELAPQRQPVPHGASRVTNIEEVEKWI